MGWVKKPWTYREKSSVQRIIDRSIWAVWSNRYAIHVRAKDGKPLKFGKLVPINFDTRWVTGKGNWTVTVWKMPGGASPTLHRSFVSPSTNEIELNTADLAPRGAGNAVGASNQNFLTAPHEFAHTFDNLDEYSKRSKHLSDSDSLVNIGREVRRRHVRLIIAALNAMLPSLVFAA